MEQVWDEVLLSRRDLLYGGEWSHTQFVQLMRKTPLVIENNKNVVIFGASGFIGGYLNQYLEKMGFKNVSTPALRQEIPKRRIFDIGFWCIGKTANFRDSTIETLDAHVNLLNAVLSNNEFGRFVLLSSTRVYQWSGDTHPSAPITLQPSMTDDLYNISKLLGESLVTQHLPEKSLILRVSNILGPAEETRNTFIGQLLRAIEKGTLILDTTLDSEKDYLWISSAIQQIYEQGFSEKTGVLNIGGGQNISNEEWIAALERKFQFCWSVSDIAKRTIFPRIELDDSCKITALIDPIINVCATTQIRAKI